MKCYTPDAFSGATFQVFLENDFFWEVALVLQFSKFVKNFQMCPNQNGMNNFEIAEYVLEIISVRPKPNIRPKFSAKLAEIFGRKFRPTCRIFGQVKKREKCGKILVFQYWKLKSTWVSNNLGFHYLISWQIKLIQSKKK